MRAVRALVVGISRVNYGDRLGSGRCRREGDAGHAVAQVPDRDPIEPSSNVTVPVGVAAADGLTVAVSVTGSPKVASPADDETATCGDIGLVGVVTLSVPAVVLTEVPGTVAVNV